MFKKPTTASLNVNAMYLCWIINPHQGFVTRDHGHQVGQGRQAVVGSLGVVLALKAKPKSFVVSSSKNSKRT
jgi:hypothetical protein